MKPASSELGLGSLLAPLTTERFLAEHWPRAPFVSHAEPARLAPLLELPELRDAASLLAVEHRRATLRFKSRDEGAPVALQVNPVLARDLYRSGGMTLVLDSVDRGIPRLRALLESMARELGTPMRPQGLLCNAYLAPAGKGAGMHFDESEVFILQVRGRKRWRFAPNAQVPYPTQPLFVGYPVPAALRELGVSFPTEMPAGAQVEELRPGSVLFLPRGYWHETHALEDSLHLTLTFTSKSWADELTERLASELPRDARWREPAAGLGAPGEAGSSARRRYAALLAELAARLGRDAGAP